MFDGPEYASYIALCRELRLERAFEEGDWYQRGRLTLCHRGQGGRLDLGADRAMPPTDVWLPRLDQWLAMLEEAGVTMVGFEQAGRGVFCRNLLYDGDESDSEAPTREEAAARLWCAVTGRPTAPPG